MLLVSQLLGHSSVSTTMRYIGINTDLMRDAVEATTRADVSECRQREAVTAFKRKLFEDYLDTASTV